MLLLLPVVIVGMILETLSVGVVIPALGILLSENYLDQFSFLTPLLKYLGQPSHELLIIFGLCGLASAFFLKISIFISRSVAKALLSTVTTGDSPKSISQIFIKWLSISS